MTIDFFVISHQIKLEETKSTLTSYATVIPFLSFTPLLAKDITQKTRESSEWYVIKYKDMNSFVQMFYTAEKEEVEKLNKTIKETALRTLEWDFHPRLFCKEFIEYKRLPPKSDLLQALENTVTNFQLENWTFFLKQMVGADKVFESMAALFYECSLRRPQLNHYDVHENLIRAFSINNEFIRRIAIRISFVYKENAENSFSESQLGTELGKINFYVLADGREPIKLIERLIEEKNEVVLRAILKELEITSVDGLIQSAINKRQTINADFLLRLPHTINDETVKAYMAQAPAPQRKSTVVDTSDIGDSEGFYFIERKFP